MSERINDELKDKIKVSLEIMAGFIEDAFESLKQDDIESLDIELNQVYTETKKTLRILNEIYINEYE